MDTIMNYLPILITLAIAQVTLAIVALVHVLKHPNYRFGNQTIWILVVLLVSTIGPIVYFVFGRSED